MSSEFSFDDFPTKEKLIQYYREIKPYLEPVEKKKAEIKAYIKISKRKKTFWKWFYQTITNGDTVYIWIVKENFARYGSYANVRFIENDIKLAKKLTRNSGIESSEMIDLISEMLESDYNITTKNSVFTIHRSDILTYIKENQIDRLIKHTIEEEKQKIYEAAKKRRVESSEKSSEKA